MRDSSKLWTIGIAGVTLAGALLFLAPQFRNAAVGARSVSAGAPVTVQQKGPALETTKIAPADVLGTGVYWAPATGDGSN